MCILRIQKKLFLHAVSLFIALEIDSPNSNPQQQAALYQPTPVRSIKILSGSIVLPPVKAQLVMGTTDTAARTRILPDTDITLKQTSLLLRLSEATAT